MFERELDCFHLEDATSGPPAEARLIRAAKPANLAATLDSLPPTQAAYLRSAGFTAEAGQLALLPGAAGVDGAVLGLGTGSDPHAFGALAGLPAGLWRLGAGIDDRCSAMLGFALGAYRFDTLSTKSAAARPMLAAAHDADDAGGVARTLSAARAVWLARDLINMPPNRLGPAELAAAACDSLAKRGAHVNVISGNELASGYPAVVAVGLGSTRAPFIVHAVWQGAHAAADAPLVSVCGKGVCFDTGGYDLKPPAGMLRMKKDMGGAAIALGLACMIIEADLPVRLELRLACVENMISGSALRPSDVVGTRSGLLVEVGNTDAEGRLVLADLLADACCSQPDILLDFATLTGAARTALGPDLPALFTNDDGLASLFATYGHAAHDSVWRLPLWEGYNSWLESSVGDLNNVSEKPHAGAIVAALFLQRFVSAGTRWAHFDVYAWNDTARPGRPAGGEAQAMRACFAGIAAWIAGDITLT